MLPYALKATWVGLCLSGTVCSGFVLNAFARNVQSWWGPMYFLGALVLLQGAFCMGIFYHMDPLTFPDAFCIVQVSLLNLAAYALVAIDGVFVWQTSIIVLKGGPPSNDSLFRWRNRYIIPLIVYPLVSVVIEISTSLSTDSWKKVDGMNCDNNSPEWVRFIGYAALPLGISVPSAIISGSAIRKIYGTYRRQRISRDRARELDKLAPPFPERAQRPNLTKPASTETTADVIRTPSPIFNPPAPQRMRRAPIDPGTGLDRRRQYHLPSRNLHPDHRYTPSSTFHYSPAPVVQSPTSPVFNSEEIRHTRRASKVSLTGDDLDDVRSPTSRTFSHKRKDSSALGRTVTSDTYGDEQAQLELNSKHALQAIWRLILYNLTFLMISLLLFISTMNDVASHRLTPSPFGTQHVALLLTAWGAVFVFGHSPGVRRNLWLRRSPAEVTPAMVEAPRNDNERSHGKYPSR